jgi:Xaa-Pro aminopeptidase
VYRSLFFVALCIPLALESQFPSVEYAERRNALISRVPDGRAVVVVLGAPEPTEDYLEFHQTPGLLYLTGLREPNAALVLVKDGGRATATAFVQPRDAAAEVWTGLRLGREGAARQTGLPARDADELTGVLDSLARVGNFPFYVIGEQSQDSLSLTSHQQYLSALQRRNPGLGVKSANQIVAQLRAKKSPRERAMLRRAVEITVAAHRAAARAIHPDMYEFEVEAVIEDVFRRNGSERPGFASIVGSGPNSTILHYNVNDRLMRAGDVVVIDVGALYKGYSADVTRTYPTSGVFSPEQRQIYQIVRDAQAAAERLAKPGAAAARMNDSATAVIAAGLAKLGLIESVNATMDVLVQGRTQQMPQHTMYYMHGLGHGIGLEVHDPEQYYFTGTLAEGSAFTIEPGIYVRPNLLEIISDTPKNRAMIERIRPAVERYRSIGIRIEDDYLVTEQGLEWISRAPRELNEIEALMKTRTMPAGRSAELLRAYRDSVP